MYALYSGGFLHKSDVGTHLKKGWIKHHWTIKQRNPKVGARAALRTKSEAPSLHDCSSAALSGHSEGFSCSLIDLSGRGTLIRDHEADTFNRAGVSKLKYLLPDESEHRFLFSGLWNRSLLWQRRGLQAAFTTSEPKPQALSSPSFMCYLCPHLCRSLIWRSFKDSCAVFRGNTHGRKIIGHFKK